MSALALAGCVVVVAGCAGDSRSTGGTTPKRGELKAKLQFMVRADEDAEPVLYTLRCPGKPQCVILQEDPKLLELEPGRACTEIYGGPEIAFVTGNIDGREVDETLKRNDGCEISRWDKAHELWRALPPEPVVRGATPEPRAV